MTSTIGIGNDKAPVGVTCAFRSDGETIPVIALGGEAIGDVFQRSDNDETQDIGIVSALTSDYPATATADDEIQVRIAGMFWVPKAAEAWSDCDRVQYMPYTNDFAKDTTGAHQVVGGYAAGDEYGLVRINVYPAAVTSAQTTTTAGE